jgi:hypothetical protein
MESLPRIGYALAGRLALQSTLIATCNAGTLAVVLSPKAVLARDTACAVQLATINDDRTRKRRHQVQALCAERPGARRSDVAPRPATGLSAND